MASDEKDQQQEDDVEAQEDLEVAEDAESVKGGLRSNPDAGAQRA